MSERHSTKVKFEAVAQNIQERINEGIYVSSQKLPSEYDLAKEFEVSRLTIRKAIDELVQKNILFKKIVIHNQNLMETILVIKDTFDASCQREKVSTVI